MPLATIAAVADASRIVGQLCDTRFEVLPQDILLLHDFVSTVSLGKKCEVDLSGHHGVCRGGDSLRPLHHDDARKPGSACSAAGTAAGGESAVPQCQVHDHVQKYPQDEANKMSEALERPKRPEDQGYLAENPQQLGIIPRGEFWYVHRPKFFAIVQGVIPSAVVAILGGYYGGGAFVSAAVGFVVAMVPLGLLERYIRRKAKRRVLAELEDHSRRSTEPPAWWNARPSDSGC